ncbi:hypothetical protein CspeluHIS016_0203700 [Cutaneotrichosporon spelunceum]|uniref:Translation initiation factor eIF4e n=1 Tax=Cutaneotrichosporon spelunceum TaxID=1672016 RepID=A0AAD3YB21_9TREE|nr:hypothetical protein CspeluHIS016_0203700 [Cutaneotrichosporon spelunceum]
MGDHKKGSSRTTSRRGARPPSLKDITERLTTATAPSALSEITASTNLPSAESRLKLPASAVARANLATSLSPPAEAAAKELLSRTPKTMLKISDDKDTPEEPFNTLNSLALSIDNVGSPTPSHPGAALGKEETTSESETGIRSLGSSKPKTLEEMRFKAHAGLGHGFPETPPRSKDDVPSIVVQRSTPGHSLTKGIESGVNSGVSIPAPSGSPRSIANGLPLEHSWSIWYDSKSYKPSPEVFAERRSRLGEWEASKLPVGTFDTIQGFWRHLNNIRQPSKLVNYGNYHMFKDNIRPSWEDPSNAHGGKWVLFVKSSKNLTVDMVWSDLVIALVGEQLDPDDHITGVVVSSRPRMDRIQIWTRLKDDIGIVNALGNRILETIGFEPQDQQTISLDFQAHEGTLGPGKYMRAGFTARSVSAGVSDLNSTNVSRVSSPLPGGSPIGTPSTLPGWPTAPHSSTPSPRQVSTTVSYTRSRIGAGGNPFSGPLGTARRAFSTAVE